MLADDANDVDWLENENPEDPAAVADELPKENAAVDSAGLLNPVDFDSDDWKPLVVLLNANVGATAAVEPWAGVDEESPKENTPADAVVEDVLPKENAAAEAEVEAPLDSGVLPKENAGAEEGAGADDGGF